MRGSGLRTIVAAMVGACMLQASAYADAPAGELHPALLAYQEHLAGGLNKEEKQVTLEAVADWLAIRELRREIDQAILDEVANDPDAKQTHIDVMLDSIYDEAGYADMPGARDLAIKAVKRYEDAGLYTRLEVVSHAPRLLDLNLLMRVAREAARGVPLGHPGSAGEQLLDSRSIGFTAYVLRARMSIGAEAGDWTKVANDLATTLRLGRMMTSHAGSSMHYLQGAALYTSGLLTIKNLILKYSPNSQEMAQLLRVIDEIPIEIDLAWNHEAERLRAVATSESSPLMLEIDGYREAVLERIDLTFAMMLKRSTMSAQERRADPMDGAAIIDTNFVGMYRPHMDFIQSMDLYASNADRTECEYQGVRLMIAIERFIRDMGQPPAALADLVPGYLPELPRDPFASDGQFRYRIVDPEADPQRRTYLLYSIGLDDQDDSGAKGPRYERDAITGDCTDCDYIINSHRFKVK